MVRALLIVLFSIFCSVSFSQKIGDDANSVKWSVENEVRNYYNAQGYHQVRQDYKVIWDEGRITEVILQKENVPDVYFRRPISFRVRYIMRGGILNEVIKEFYDIKTSYLVKYARDLHKGKRINEFLFSLDYATYSKVYTDDNGLAAILTKKTVINDFQPHLQKIVLERLNDAKNTSNSKKELFVSSSTDPKLSKNEFIEVDSDAEYIGGRIALINYLNKSFKYPKSAQQDRIGGRVGLLFTIDIDGSIRDLKVIEGYDIGYGLIEELKKVVMNMPKWKPALFKEKPLPSNQELELTFIPPGAENYGQGSIEFTKKNKAVMPKRVVED